MVSDVEPDGHLHVFSGKSLVRSSASFLNRSLLLLLFAVEQCDFLVLLEARPLQRRFAGTSPPCRAPLHSRTEASQLDAVGLSPLGLSPDVACAEMPSSRIPLAESFTMKGWRTLSGAFLHPRMVVRFSSFLPLMGFVTLICGC